MPRLHYRGYSATDVKMGKLLTACRDGKERKYQHEFGCPACPKNFKTEAEYKNHWKVCHTNATDRIIAHSFILTAHGF